MDAIAQAKHTARVLISEARVRRIGNLGHLQQCPVRASPSGSTSPAGTAAPPHPTEAVRVMWTHLSLPLQPSIDRVPSSIKSGSFARKMIEQSGQKLSGLKRQLAHFDVTCRVEPDRGPKPSAKNEQLRFPASNVFVLDHIRARNTATTAAESYLLQAAND